ncbi:aldo/keto reductase [Halococcus saccharolyticus]|uniref:Aldo/keto reductase n=1 Tax=Halococcus saccharolyticus DSM 5350 TaxID=1227455 RepID=M0MKD1_9EURY|nr:aldo/keto reductase [Halococcus saccharolyticus]EMA44900.1 aldo/keto reductase [Halococcus saccharolyticus DSM 5350]
MEYTSLGSTGTKVSKLCLGTWRFGKQTGDVLETDREEAHELLDAAAERGINFIDTANGYGDGDSERWIGEWLDDRDREEYVIASKVYWSQESRFTENLGRKNIRTEIEGTLDRLGTDYLDVYYIHRFDDDTPVEETLRTLNDLVREGKVNHLGASTMAAWKLTKALWKSDVEGLERFEVTQPLYHAAYYEDVSDYLEVCADQDLAVCPYSPLAGGFLTGKYERSGEGVHDVEAPDGSRGSFDEFFDDYYVSERGWDVLDAVRGVADEIDATPAQVALRWLIEREQFTCVPIVGARTVDQLDENLGAVDISLSSDHHDRIDAARAGEQ